MAMSRSEMAKSQYIRSTGPSMGQSKSYSNLHAQAMLRQLPGRRNPDAQKPA